MAKELKNIKSKPRNTKSLKLPQALNEVHLRGRVTSISGSKKLPSGDQVSEFRIVINRSRGAAIDTIDIAAWSAKLRKRITLLEVGQWVEVFGCVRRRFWQSKAGLASRWQVEASDIRRL